MNYQIVDNLYEVNSFRKKKLCRAVFQLEIPEKKREKNQKSVFNSNIKCALVRYQPMQYLHFALSFSDNLQLYPLREIII